VLVTHRFAAVTRAFPWTTRILWPGLVRLWAILVLVAHRLAVSTRALAWTSGYFRTGLTWLRTIAVLPPERLCVLQANLQLLLRLLQHPQCLAQRFLGRLRCL